ncbi:hypothetical protein CAS74_001408 [Pichia kudriavzevii]|uniref:Skg3/CAF120-like PH-like domain-containing protein n=1 Tax=Pichia kudriavzevii TaxID=4909 RepID=A0A1Z8JRC7_PICKU|nr:hypothetical protein CAS74_001408 [Pichia kudriavzevii]
MPFRVFSKNKDKDSRSKSSTESNSPTSAYFPQPNLASQKSRKLSMSSNSPTLLTPESTGKLAPELTPIVSLLSAQSHRKYIEGVFMLLKDLDSDGNPAERKWLEVYGIMIGNELAYWDSQQLDSKDSNAMGDSKPSYLNFSDGTLKPCLTLPSSNNTIENVIVLSTTLKNRFLLQFSSRDKFLNWCTAFRLSSFEYTSLQEAYTASLLSARGSLLSDIRVILSETKFNHEDWTSVRFGSGMPWKRYFAVIEPGKFTRKGPKNGAIYFYDNEKKSKKSLMAKITNITSVYALYPRNYTVIDHSTLIKLDGSIQFDQKDSSKSCSIFLMPEQHTSVPGYDTLIRFIIPLMDSFHLYGRPKKLNADKRDTSSLLFGLPVLPNVHYLELEDLDPIIKDITSIDWDQNSWNIKIKQILKGKMDKGYNGCGSQNGIQGVTDLLAASNELADGKTKFLVNKPEVHKYLESSSSLKNFNSSGESIDLLSKKISHSNNSKRSNELNSSPLRNVTKTPIENTTTTMPKNSPSPHPVNIYTKYSQIPDNRDVNQQFNRLDIDSNDRSIDGNRKTTEDDDDDDDDDGSEESELHFNKPSNHTSPLDQRVFSPFTDFNNSFRDALKLDNQQSHRIKPLEYQNDAAGSHLMVKKQRSPDGNRSLAQNERANQRAPSDRIPPQKVSYNYQDTLDLPPVNPYKPLPSSSPSTPLDQQYPPSNPVLNFKNPSRPMREPISKVDSPLETNLKKIPFSQPQTIQNQGGSYQYTNSPELKPPHSYSGKKNNENIVPQVIKQSSSNPLNSPSLSIGKYGPMKLPSPQLNSHPQFQQHSEFMPDTQFQSQPAQPHIQPQQIHQHQYQHKLQPQQPNHHHPNPLPPSQQQQPYMNQQMARNQNQGGYQPQGHPGYIHPVQYKQQHQQPSMHYGNPQALPPMGYPANQGPPLMGYSANQGPPPMGYRADQGLPPMSANAHKNRRPKRLPPPTMQQPAGGKSFKHDPYALTKQSK